jgi:hypothetical protein
LIVKLKYQLLPKEPYKIPTNARIHHLTATVCRGVGESLLYRTLQSLTNMKEEKSLGLEVYI